MARSIIAPDCTHGSRHLVVNPIELNNVLATQTRQPPTWDSARASYENQNQNIKILLYYITTMSSTTPQLLSLDQEDQM